MKKAVRQIEVSCKDRPEFANISICIVFARHVRLAGMKAEDRFVQFRCGLAQEPGNNDDLSRRDRLGKAPQQHQPSLLSLANGVTNCEPHLAFGAKPQILQHELPGKKSYRVSQEVARISP